MDYFISTLSLLRKRNFLKIFSYKLIKLVIRLNSYSVTPVSCKLIEVFGNN